MLSKRTFLKVFGLKIVGPMSLAALVLTSCTTANSTSQTSSSNFERDRQSILAMAGAFKVSFDLRETVSFVDGYTPAPGKPSKGNEFVKVIEDSGTTIRLQHILVGKTREGKEFLVKHWRQDWLYQPATVMVFEGDSTWTLKPVRAADRKGTWSQTVWQSDDSPRYGGVGSWRYDGGETRWTAYDSIRPLARRDAVKKPPFDRYIAMNRHALTPTGWVHEQDNAKQGERNGRRAIIVHEVGVNAYDRSPDVLAEIGERYWKATADFWIAVRKQWDAQLAKTGTLKVPEVAETGSVTTMKLLTLADEIADGKRTTASAIAEAVAAIESNTTTAKN